MRGFLCMSGRVLRPDVSVFVPGISGASICLAVCRLSNKGLGLGGCVCGRGGWKCVGGGVREGAGGAWSFPVSPPTLSKAAPDWLPDCRAQVTFASGAERGRATGEHC